MQFTIYHLGNVLLETLGPPTRMDVTLTHITYLSIVATPFHGNGISLMAVACLAG